MMLQASPRKNKTTMTILNRPTSRQSAEWPSQARLLRTRLHLYRRH
jgi:hypothetical protein